MFYLIPRGGSLLTLIDYAKTDEGNMFDGMEVMIKRKSGCKVPADCKSVNRST